MTKKSGRRLIGRTISTTAGVRRGMHVKWKGHSPFSAKWLLASVSRLECEEIIVLCGSAANEHFEALGWHMLKVHTVMLSACRPHVSYHHYSFANFLCMTLQSCLNSHAYATRYTISSLHHLPTICSPTGNRTSSFPADGPSSGGSELIGKVRAG